MEVKTARELMEMALVAARSKEDQALSWLLGNFAANAKVEFSEEVGNVRIQKTGAEWMVSFNPEFAQKYFSVPDDVLFVLLHEIMHNSRFSFGSPGPSKKIGTTGPSHKRNLRITPLPPVYPRRTDNPGGQLILLPINDKKISIVSPELRPGFTLLLP